MGKFRKGIVRSEGYAGGRQSNGGMKNKRKSKVAKIRFEEKMSRLQRQREDEERNDAWLEEWGTLSGED